MFQLRVDPRTESYVPLTGVLSSAGTGDIALLQILFQAVAHPWHENILRVVSDTWDPSKSAFVDLPDLPRTARHKVERPLYAVAIRVAASSQELLDRLDMAFIPQMESGENGLVPVARQYPLDAVWRRFTHTEGMLLNARELAAVGHFPNPRDLPSGALAVARRSAKAPPAAARPLASLGVNRHRGLETPVGLSAEQMPMHVFIQGFTGSGKSTALKKILVEVMELGYGLFLFDFSGDASEELLELVPEHRVGDVIYINLADREFYAALNVLRSSTGDIEVLASDLMVALKRLLQGRAELGHRTEWYLRQALRTLLASRGEKTLRDVPRLLMNPEYREEVLRTVDDADLQEFWSRRQSLSAAVVDPILNRLSTFTDNPVIRNVICQPGLIDLDQAMSQAHIGVFRLPIGILGE